MSESIQNTLEDVGSAETNNEQSIENSQEVTPNTEEGNIEAEINTSNEGKEGELTKDDVEKVKQIRDLTKDFIIEDEKQKSLEAVDLVGSGKKAEQKKEGSKKEKKGGSGGGGSGGLLGKIFGLFGKVIGVTTGTMIRGVEMVTNTMDPKEKTNTNNKN